MYILILFLPFTAFIVSGFFGIFLGRYGSLILSVSLIGLSFFLSLVIFYEVVLCGSCTFYNLFNWFILEGFTVSFGLYFDALTSIMLLIITSISFLVHFYSIDYMRLDPYQNRFMCYLSLFTFFMLLLVTADNFLQLFIGWEGVGLCSYLLINFWFTRILANKAALKAMIMNRIADVFFLFAIILVLLIFKTTDYLIIFNLAPYYSKELFYFLGFSVPLLSLISFFLFLGAIGKSAQLGFHTWLPDAMEGPTPVSSLLHAATMVTAGVFLLLRCSPIFEYAPGLLLGITLLGGLTAFFFSIVAIFQYDLKKVIAYSTCSQLGYMFFSCGLSNYSVAIFHLFNHAFFKALLFLGAGAIIHAFFDEQDMRRMGAVANFLPFLYFCMFIASVAILGLPFFSGFYSKDLLLELTYSRYIIDSEFIHYLGLAAAFFTAVYSMRLLLLIFFFYEGKLTNVFFPSKFFEVSFFMFVPLFILSLGSIFLGYIFSEIFTGSGTCFFLASLFVLEEHFIAGGELDYLDPFIKILPVYLSIGGAYTSYWIFYFITMYDLLIEKHGSELRLLQDGDPKIIWKKLDDGIPRLRGPAPMGPYNFAINEFLFSRLIDIFVRYLGPWFYFAGHFNSLYNSFFLSFYSYTYNVNTKLVDKGLLEFIGPFGFYVLFRTFSGLLKSQFSTLFFNIFYMFFSLCCLSFFILFGHGLFLCLPLGLIVGILPLLILLFLY